MNPILSANTQAILLLTAPLISGREPTSPDLLTPGEYKRLARHLRDIQHQPSDLVAPGSTNLLELCQLVVDGSRLQRLLERGFLLSEVVERWRARAIWVVSRADPEYPRILKARLRDDAPAVLYGCGDIGLLDSGGLAIVGSRDVDAGLVDYTTSIGMLAAQAGRTVISGGARGIDQAAMRGALEAGGRTCGILADSLERAAMNREHRDQIIGERLVLVSPYDPSAGFNVGNAMQRNKIIYAFADAALVVSSDLNKGGTWSGAVEQLGKYKFVPVFVRSTGYTSAGLEGLRMKGALAWPEPRDIDELEAIFRTDVPPHDNGAQVSLFSHDSTTSLQAMTDVAPAETAAAASIIGSPTEENDNGPYPAHQAKDEDGPQGTKDAIAPSIIQTPPPAASSPAEVVFSAVRTALLSILDKPLKDAEIAEALGVSNTQAKEWLKRLVSEGVVEKRSKPAGYVASQKKLFD
jgi:predicted Rossmann fold nucleotide-binding protein DprA/Smf involved in DNA uptake